VDKEATMKKSYRWTGKEFVEIEPEDRVSYADRVAAERELDRLAREKRENDEHPGRYA